ncbi:DNA-binding response regulator [Pradoshia eiseniae]|uniref:DNA-binding response regulator n=1 Tax=Pradoshia eiseniae TaxID=2064768 RepID=A0A2S7MW50_9BACI|nr:response regulator [Pradoshia eiseniae]PQD94042.1 DNA-binding response regulator [Pradoshia eiseniae]
MITALIVEDEDIIRQGMVYTIDWNSMGAEIVGEATTGQQGLEKIKELRPDLVITDIKMPLMDGITMVEEALKFHDFETIILTSYSDFGFTKKSIQLQVFDYLLKPVDRDNLRTVVESAREKLVEKRRKDSLLKQAVLLQPLSQLEQEGGRKDHLSIYTQKALEFINEFYAKRISIEDAAGELAISSSYLSRLFKKETAETFHHYLNKHRIKVSIPYLLSGNYMIYEIAELVGFSDYKQYNAAFKKYIGIAPTEFTQKMR